MLGATQMMRELAEVMRENRPTNGEPGKERERQWESDIISVGMVLAKTVPKFRFNDFAERCGLMEVLKQKDTAKIIRTVKS